MNISWKLEGFGRGPILHETLLVGRDNGVVPVAVLLDYQGLNRGRKTRAYRHDVDWESV